MSFATNLLDGLEKVVALTDGNFSLYKEASNFLKKYVTMEEESSRNIQKFCRQTLDNSKGFPSNSLTQGWEKMISTSELAAKDRADVFSRINVTIANSLGEQRKVLEGTLKALKNDGDRFTKDLQNMYASESKLRVKYQTNFNEWEAAILQLERECSGHRKSSGLTKLQDKADSTGKKTLQTKTELIQTINALNETQRNYYQTQLPSILKRYEEFNTYIGQIMVNALKSFSDSWIEICNKSLQHSAEFYTEKNSFNFPEDIKNFVLANTNPQFQIPSPIQFEEIFLNDNVKKAIENSKPGARKASEPDFTKKDPPVTIIEETPPILPRRPSEPEIKGETPTTNSKPLPQPQPKPFASILRRVSTNNVTVQNPQNPPTEKNPFQNALNPPVQVNQMQPRSPPQQPRSLPPSPKPRRKKTPKGRCLYESQAASQDELSFVEGEILEILENTENWWKAKNSSGDIGLVPGNYIELLPDSTEDLPLNNFSAKNSDIQFDPSVPRIVQSCIQFLLQNDNIKTEGIFRVPGNLREMKELKLRFEREGDVEIPSNSDPLTIAGLLKLYFRESADFPITKDFRRNLVDTWQIEDLSEKIACFVELFGSLDSSRFGTLKVLIHFFLLVIQSEEQNKMNSNNLSKVFGLSLFPDLSPTLANGLVEFWILHFDSIFNASLPPSFI